MQRGKIVLLRSLGVVNVQDSVPVNNKSIFAINSCTKAFTGVAVMQLVEDGKIDLSAPVSSYLDGLPASWRPVTVRQLLTHVSGLPNILNVLDPATGKLTGRDDEDAAWAKVQAMPLEFAAGMTNTLTEATRPRLQMRRTQSENEEDAERGGRFAARNRRFAE